MYMTVKEEMNQRRVEMYGSYFKNVFIDKREGAFAEWIQSIEELSNKTQKWTRKLEECYRLMIGEPIEDRYIMAPTVIRLIFSNKKIKQLSIISIIHCDSETKQMML